MIIKFSPMRRDCELRVIKSGEVLTINGESIDFSEIPEGATLPAEAINHDWIVGDIHREGGELTLTLVLPITADASDAARFPEDLAVTANGPLELPR